MQPSSIRHDQIVGSPGHPDAVTIPLPPDSEVIAAVDGLVNSGRTSREVHPVSQSLSPPAAEVSLQHPAEAKHVFERYLDSRGKEVLRDPTTGMSLHYGDDPSDSDTEDSIAISPVRPETPVAVMTEADEEESNISSTSTLSPPSTPQVAAEIPRQQSPDLPEDHMHTDPIRATDDLTMHFKKSLTPPEVLAKLKELKKDAAQLKIDTDKVHTDLIAKHKELHGDHLSPVHIPKAMILEAEEKIYVEMGERFGLLNREMKKCQKDLARYPADTIDDKLKGEIKDEFSAIGKDLDHIHDSISNQLSFHRGTKIAQMLEQLVRLMHEMNELIRLINGIH